MNVCECDCVQFESAKVIKIKINQAQSSESLPQERWNSVNVSHVPIKQKDY
uniref:Uncharacterized protein n=1 Tax=Anopheles quadriannulatus TaxID=34691 RepID=A0A182XRI3_ANOQN